MAAMKEKGMHDLGIKPEKSIAPSSSKSSESKPYYPSLHIGHGAGVELPAGEHHFHIKANVGVNVRQRPGEKPERSHDLEVTHIKHLAPADNETKGPKDPEAALDEAFGKISQEKLGKGQASDQHDESESA